MTYVRTPAEASIEMTFTVFGPSRQSSGPPRPLGSQQFGGTPGWHIEWTCSRFAVHWSSPQDSDELQLGPPSVARIANVGPSKDVRMGASLRKVAAVGVPPSGFMFVAMSSSAEVI